MIKNSARPAVAEGAAADAAPPLFAALADRLDAGEATYLRRRALLDGPDLSGNDFVEAAADELATALGAEGPAFADWLLDNRHMARRLTLNAGALLALRAGRWEQAEALAREVTARDHHDLMAQRITDAAAERASDLRTEADRWLADRICTAPFRQIETRTDRSVHFCCSAWQPVPIGKIKDPSAEADSSGFWTSPQALEIRRSVTEGDFSYCSRWHCPAIANRRLPLRPTADAPKPAPPVAAAALHLRSAAEKPDLDGAEIVSQAKVSVQASGMPQAGPGPKRIILSHDRSCNISCPSCRTKVILANHDASRELDRLFELSIMPYLAQAEDIKVTGSGDPFGSRHFRQVLAMLCAQGRPRRRIQLHTNGLLANERAWNELGLWENVSSVWVSVDAARPETYAVLRRGGDFDQLVQNLRFLGKLSARGAIDSLRLDFVVQRENYQQLGEFVDLADKVGADGVYFLRLRNWGHFSADEFRALDVCDAAHPLHDRLLQQLADPRMQHKGVDLGSVASLRGLSKPV